MNNLLNFFIKHSAWFIFAIYVILSLVLLFKDNPYQQSVYLTSANSVSAAVYKAFNNVTAYFHLRDINESLQERNAALEMELIELRNTMADLALQQPDSLRQPALGQYTFVMAQVISNSIALVQYARIANADDRAYAQKLTLDLGKICLLVSALAVVVLCLLPPAFYTFVFGPEFGEMAGLIRILAPGILLYCIFLILGHYYSGTGRYQMNTFAALCGLVVTFVCGFTLIPRYDVTGAAITSAVSYTVNAVFLFVLFVKESHFKGRDFLLTKGEIQNYIAGLKQQFLKQPTENEQTP